MPLDDYLGPPPTRQPSRRRWLRPGLVGVATVAVITAGVIAFTNDDSKTNDNEQQLGLPGGPVDGSNTTGASGEPPADPNNKSLTTAAPRQPSVTTNAPSGTGRTGTGAGGTTAAPGGTTAAPDGPRGPAPTIARTPTTPQGPQGPSTGPSTTRPSTSPSPTAPPTTVGPPAVQVDTPSVSPSADCYPDICLAVVQGTMSNASPSSAVYLLTRLQGGPWTVQWYSDSYGGHWVTEAEFSPFCGTRTVEIRAALLDRPLPDSVEETFALDALGSVAPNTRVLATSDSTTVSLRSNRC